MGEQDKLNWVNVINFLEVVDISFRKSITKSASERRSGATRNKYSPEGSKAFNQKSDQMSRFAKDW